MMETSVKAFMRAVKNFASWMDIRKRPEKSNGGLLLKTVTEEQDCFQIAMDDYVKDFFLLNYLGREESVLAYAWVVQTGKLPFEDISLINPRLELTKEPGTFMAGRDSLALYQDGFIVIDEEILSGSRTVDFDVRGEIYRFSAEKRHIWNIFDEFAMFLSLKRFDGESNRNLVRRCFSVFGNPANSSEEGIKNAIINAVSADGSEINDGEIRIEGLTRENAYLRDADSNQIYELIANANRDVNRKKIWDKDTWEHNFKELMYLPHVWDAPVETYQDGTGQNGDLLVSLIGEEAGEGTTDVAVYGYEESRATIDEYVRKNRIKREIPLKLLAYRNEIKPETVQYRISATEVRELDASKIKVKSFTAIKGESKHNLEDIVTEAGRATVRERGRLEAGKEYALKFRSKSPYSEMIIRKADLIEDGVERSLLVENGEFKKINGSVVNSNISLHADSVNKLKNYRNFIDTGDGMTLSPEADEGSLDVDLAGMGGKYYKIQVRCEAEDITSNAAMVRPYGFIYREDSNSYIADDTGSESCLEIETSCREFSFMLAPAAVSSKQGSCVVTIYVDGEILSEDSGLWTKAKSYSKRLDKFSDVKIRIQKSGMYPVEIKNITAVRYDISTGFDYGKPYITSFGEMLPREEGKPNTLHIRLKAYGTYTPVIEFIHIGSSVKNAVYEIPNIKPLKAECRLSIDSTCVADLYEISNGNETLIEEDFVTTALYINETADPLYLVINTEDFVEIRSSSKPIKSTSNGGIPVKYITLSPGESLDSVCITGTANVMRNSFLLSNVLGCKKSERVYLSAGAEGLILRDDSTGTEKIAVIKRETFDAAADFYRLENLPSWAVACFVIDRNEGIISRGNETGRNFEYVYVTAAEGETYIAYNSSAIITTPTSGIPLVNTFSPILEEGKLMFYRIDPPVSSSLGVKAYFEKRENQIPLYEDWTLGLKPYGITIEADLEYTNAESYNSDITAFTGIYSLSSSIALPHEITINGENELLSKYIVTPPEDMQVNYASELRRQEIIAEDDRFNKLYDSNIREIELVRAEGKIVPASHYSLLEREGIIVWNTSEYAGKNCEIIYRYLQPKTLEYKDIRSLYDIVGYSVSAYKPVSDRPLEFSALSDGDERKIDFGEHKAAKVIVRCSNLNFQARIEAGVLKVKKVNSENVAVVNAGFYYDDGEEYYFFNHRHEESIDGAAAVRLWNVRHIGNAYKLISRSTNHLKDSKFMGKHERRLCEIDFRDLTEDYGISSLKNLTGCETYNMWNQCDMDVGIRDGYNSLGIYFKPRSENGYAVLDLSSYLLPGYVLSLYASEGIRTALLKGCLIDGDSPNASVCAEKYLEETICDAGFRRFVLPEDSAPGERYYLLVQGEGIVDDIISCLFDDKVSESELHTRNVNAVGFSIIEKIPAETEYCLQMDSGGGLLDGLQFRKDMTLETGSNVEWGLTGIYSLKRDNRAVLSNLKYNGELWLAEGEEGTLTVADIEMKNRKAMAAAYIKVNDVFMDGYEGFTITAYGADAKGGNYKKLTAEKNSNILKLLPGKITPFIRVSIEMPKGKVINNVEVLAKYAETDYPLRIRPEEKGNFVSKVYDTGIAGTFSPRRIDGEADNIENCRIFVRGARRDAEDCVWTEWYELHMDANMKFIKDPHIFKNYRLFQFRVSLENERAKLRIRNFVLEVL